MNLKDRLVISKQPDNNMKKEDSFETSSLFKNSKKQTQLIRDYILDNKNIVFLADRTLDRAILVRYIQLILPEKQINLLESPDEENLSVISKINMIKDPDIIDFVKILQSVILGYKPFVSCLSLNFNENLIDIFKALISANYSNLTEKHIDTLFNESDIVFVNVVKQNDDWTIASVVEFPFRGKVKTNTITKEAKSQKEIKNILEDDEPSIIDEPEIIEENKEEENQTDINSSNQEEIQTPVIEDEPVNAEKVNKYKLLREKIRAKKNS